MGTTKTRNGWKECPRCKGTGQSRVDWQKACPSCHGTGQQIKKRSPPTTPRLSMKEVETPIGETSHPAQTVYFQWDSHNPWKHPKQLSSTGEPRRIGRGTLCGCPVKIRATSAQGQYHLQCWVTLPNGKTEYEEDFVPHHLLIVPPRTKKKLRYAFRQACQQARAVLLRNTEVKKGA